MNNYFPAKFKQDISLMKDDNIKCLCGKSWSTFYEKGLQTKVLDLKKLIICLYELNLIDQIIYDHFSSANEQWIAHRPDHISCRCSCMSSPIEIFNWSRHGKMGKDQKLTFSHNDLLEADQYFMDYLESFAKAINQYQVNKESILNAMRSDPDCNPQRLAKYLE